MNTNVIMFLSSISRFGSIFATDILLIKLIRPLNNTQPCFPIAQCAMCVVVHTVRVPESDRVQRTEKRRGVFGINRNRAQLLTSAADENGKRLEYHVVCRTDLCGRQPTFGNNTDERRTCIRRTAVIHVALFLSRVTKTSARITVGDAQTIRANSTRWYSFAVGVRARRICVVVVARSSVADVIRTYVPRRLLIVRSVFGVRTDGTRGARLKTHVSVYFPNAFHRL